MARQEDREKFVRLASTRVSRALKDIQLIGNLANRSNYDYSDEDVNKIFKALQDEITTCRRRFQMSTRRPKSTSFKL